MINNSPKYVINMSFLCRFYVIIATFKKHINHWNTIIYNAIYVECH